MMMPIKRENITMKMVILMVFYFGLEMTHLSADFFVAVTIDTFLFIIDFIFT